jgi:hypothetical protein
VPLTHDSKPEQAGEFAKVEEHAKWLRELHGMVKVMCCGSTRHVILQAFEDRRPERSERRRRSPSLEDQRIHLGGCVKKTRISGKKNFGPIQTTERGPVTTFPNALRVGSELDAGTTGSIKSTKARRRNSQQPRLEVPAI